MRYEKKIKINSTPKRIYDIVTDAEILTKWNLGVDNIEAREEGKNFLLKSAVGDILIVDWETKENEFATWHMKNSDMDSIGYIIEPRGDNVETTLWVDFENKKLKKSFEKVGELTLKSLKNFVEFIEDGGNPEEFDKKQLMVSP
ncbi:MAG: SRPBCC domain-containing protein [Promethearchaeota archaeon]